MTRQAGVLAAALIAGAGPALATQKNAGVNTAQFLMVGAGARALAMGEAFGPVADGAEAIYWNPAGLAQLKTPQLSYTRSEFLQFFHHDFAAFAQPLPSFGTLGVSFTHLSQDSLPVVSNSNITLGRFTPHSEAVAIAYAHAFALDDSEGKNLRYFGQSWSLPDTYHPFQDHDFWAGALAIGVSLKVLQESLYQRNTSAVAVDGGVLFKPVALKDLSLSFVLRNLGGKERFIEYSEPLPAEMDLGISYNAKSPSSRFTSAFELALPYYGNPYAKLGFEYAKPVTKNAVAAFRFGYKTLAAVDLSPLSGLTCGLGVSYRKVGIDFGLEPLAELGQIYRLTLNLRW